jgi:hypothetical protein
MIDKRRLPKIGEEVSRLGMGLMRLPCDDKGIDYPAAETMIDRLIEAGVTYFDTAWFYHNNTSEDFARKALAERYPRDAFTIATKMPLGEVEENGGPQAVFDKQQKNLGVEFIDFYLMHGINPGSLNHMAQLGADEVVRKMQRDGRIRYKGFSYHGAPGDLGTVLDGFEWDFCMVVLHYYDWIAGEAEKLYKAATERNVPLIVMEPVRGGGLARCHPDIMRVFETANPGVSVASWALRWVGSLPGVDIVLSGMSNMEQVEDNIRHFSPLVPMTDAERAVIAEAMETFKKLPLIPCTECNYCAKCPHGIPIPRLFGGKNDMIRFGSSWYLQNYKNWTKPENRMSVCTACGVCEDICPMKLNIIERLKALDAELG